MTYQYDLGWVTKALLLTALSSAILGGSLDGFAMYRGFSPVIVQYDLTYGAVLGVLIWVYAFSRLAGKDTVQWIASNASSPMEDTGENHD